MLNKTTGLLGSGLMNTYFYTLCGSGRSPERDWLDSFLCALHSRLWICQ